ncbi:hypothetical protein PCYB_004090 [Plasmodium cynomolgi strain B]|uniref:Uncharacterized protein n=1 Tax=Plasmodium cynomolgi (strain B) TaxID=1120755 RepID=K6V2X4_PLACD|nr:hypothetical protein PCYB_004090 [Plasmodium cynomolgi strain B]GAB69660.1 hypothetical protein PCYB_004090 [Plasmodium cynomolgi strain B]
MVIYFMYTITNGYHRTLRPSEINKIVDFNSSHELIYISNAVLTYISHSLRIIGHPLKEMDVRNELSNYLMGN